MGGLRAGLWWGWGLSACWGPPRWGSSDSCPHLLGLGPAAPLDRLSLGPGNRPVCVWGGVDYRLASRRSTEARSGDETRPR